MLEKAKILIADDRVADRQITTEEAVKATKRNSSINTTGLASNLAGSLSDYAETAASAASAAADTAQKAALLAKKAGYEEQFESYANEGWDKLNKLYSKVFTVQFNPATLTLDGSAGGEVTKTDYSCKSDDELKMGGRELQIHMGVQLIFNQVDNLSSFQGDTMNLNVNSAVRLAAKGIGKAVSAVKGSTTNDVQTQVEGFLAAVANSRTRLIKFVWGKMEYAGMLRHVTANYTMFDMFGCPVHAEVDLQIYLRDPDITATDMGYWARAYEATFKADSKFLDNSTVADRIGSLVNLSM